MPTNVQLGVHPSLSPILCNFPSAVHMDTFAEVKSYEIPKIAFLPFIISVHIADTTNSTVKENIKNSMLPEWQKSKVTRCELQVQDKRVKCSNQRIMSLNL